MKRTAKQDRVGPTRYLEQFLRMSAAPLLLREVSWTTDPVKEITESVAMLNACLNSARTYGIQRSDASISVLVVGDGTSPRTGALIASATNWKVTSVDPAMTLCPRDIKRLECVAAKIEDMWKPKAHFVVSPHSHAPVSAVMGACLFGGFVIAMPCCVPWPEEGALVYTDKYCISPANKIHIYRGA